MSTVARCSNRGMGVASGGSEYCTCSRAAYEGTVGQPDSRTRASVCVRHHERVDEMVFKISKRVLREAQHSRAR